MIIKRFILMLQFLTTIPIPLKINAKDDDFGKGLVFAPVIGLIIGGFLCVAYFLLEKLFPVYICAALVLVLYVILTGGLHIDGLGDTFDGAFSGRPRERMLEIMRDSRVGTFGILAIVLTLLLDICLLIGNTEGPVIKVLLLFPVAGRIGSLTGAGFSRYARSGDGLGKSFIDYCNIREVCIGSLFYFIIFFAVDNIRGLIISLFFVFTAFILTKFLTRKITGATGDILGAVCELNQAIFLLAAYIIFNKL